MKYMQLSEKEISYKYSFPGSNICYSGHALDQASMLVIASLAKDNGLTSVQEVQAQEKFYYYVYYDGNVVSTLHM